MRDSFREMLKCLWVKESIAIQFLLQILTKFGSRKIASKFFDRINTTLFINVIHSKYSSHDCISDKYYKTYECYDLQNDANARCERKKIWYSDGTGNIVNCRIGPFIGAQNHLSWTFMDCKSPSQIAHTKSHGLKIRCFPPPWNFNKLDFSLTFNITALRNFCI